MNTKGFRGTNGRRLLYCGIVTYTLVRRCRAYLSVRFVIQAKYDVEQSVFLLYKLIGLSRVSDAMSDVQHCLCCTWRLPVMELPAGYSMPLQTSSPAAGRIQENRHSSYIDLDATAHFEWSDTDDQVSVVPESVLSDRDDLYDPTTEE